MEESARIYVSPTDGLHKRVMRYYKPFLRGEFILLSILTGSLFFGYATLIAVYIFSAKVPPAAGAIAYILILVPLGFRFVRYKLLMFYSDFALMVVLIVDFLLNVIVLIIQYSTTGFIPLFVTLIIVAAGLLLNVAFTFYSFMDVLALHIRLTKKEYVVAEGVVIFKSVKTEGGYRAHWNNYTVDVKSRGDHIIPVEHILRRQYKECSVASSVLLIIPEPVETQLSSSIRLAVEPFGQDNQAE